MSLAMNLKVWMRLMQGKWTVWKEKIMCLDQQNRNNHKYRFKVLHRHLVPSVGSHRSNPRGTAECTVTKALQCCRRKKIAHQRLHELLPILRPRRITFWFIGQNLCYAYLPAVHKSLELRWRKREGLESEEFSRKKVTNRRWKFFA